MTSIPTIRIEQQSALLGLTTHAGNMEIRQPQASMEMRTTPLKIEIQSPQGELRIDQSRAWDALGIGSRTTFLNRIYSESKQIVLQGIARIVENGNRMAAIHNGSDAIADIAAEQAFASGGINYLGEASYDNVDIEYTPHKPIFQVDPGSVQIRITPNKPEIQYHPGKVDVYMARYPSLKFIPPQLDVKI
jgi:hypothetical protein